MKIGQLYRLAETGASKRFEKAANGFQNFDHVSREVSKIAEQELLKVHVDHKVQNPS